MDVEGGAGNRVRQWRVGFYEYSIIEGTEGPYVEARATRRGYTTVTRFEWAEWKRRTWVLVIFCVALTSLLLGGALNILSMGGADDLFGLSIVAGFCLPIPIVAYGTLPMVYHTYKYVREHARFQ